MTPRFWRPATIAFALTLALAACTSAESSPPAASEPEGSEPATESAAPTGGGEPEIAELTVGTLPIVDVAPVHLAIAEGLFEDEGLTVTPEVMQGGAAAIPALQGGDLDIAFGAWPSFLIANQQGIGLQAVSDGVAATPGFTEFLAAGGSDLEDNPAGMAGTTVALNTLGNLGELALRATLQDAGLEYSDVTAVELPFPDMGAALDGGTVDVIWAVEPGVTGNKTNLGAVTVIDSYVDEMEGFPVAGYFVTTEFAEQNPNTVAAFTRAIQAAAEMLNEDTQVVIDTVGTYTELPPELVEQLAFPEYRGVLDVAELERVYESLLEFEMIEEGLDVGSLVLTSD
jgi:ABC-type nitrate/sulfonate/bicarbonate transport system substrate-binding protein